MKVEKAGQGTRNLLTVAVGKGPKLLEKYSNLLLKINEHMKRPLKITC